MINNILPYKEFQCDGKNDLFEVKFPVQDGKQILVLLIQGTERRKLVYGTDYTVTPLYPNQWETGAKITTRKVYGYSNQLFVIRNTDINQTIKFINAHPNSIEKAVDKLTEIAQEQQYYVEDLKDKGVDAINVDGAGNLKGTLNLRSGDHIKLVRDGKQIIINATGIEVKKLDGRDVEISSAYPNTTMVIDESGVVTWRKNFEILDDEFYQKLGNKSKDELEELTLATIDEIINEEN